MISMQFTEGRGAFLDLAIQSRQLDEGIRKGIRELAAEYRGQLIADLSRPGTGNEYGRAAVYRAAFGGTRTVRRKVTLFGGAQVTVTRREFVNNLNLGDGPYRASAQGKPPAQLTGTLLRSIRTKFPPREKGYGAKVFAHRGTAFYRHFLEFGTAPRRTKKPSRFVGRVAPRPVFSPLQAKLQAAIEARMLRAIDDFAQGRATP